MNTCLHMTRGGVHRHAPKLPFATTPEQRLLFHIFNPSHETVRDWAVRKVQLSRYMTELDRWRYRRALQFIGMNPDLGDPAVAAAVRKVMP